MSNRHNDNLNRRRNRSLYTITDIVDSKSHRGDCKAKETILALQKQCAVCAKSVKNSEKDCNKCGGIKHCSDECEAGDK